MEEKIHIVNREQQDIVGLLRTHESQKGCAIVQHGLGGTKDEAHIKATADTFFEAGYTTVRFDATNTFGESDGTYELATMTKHCADLEDVVAWAQRQSWWGGRKVLSGHSLGGYAVLRYAANHPGSVDAIVPLSPVVSGELSFRAHDAYDPAYILKWKETGWREDRSVSHPERLRRLPWSHMEDRLTHDILPDAHHITIPVCIIVGDTDRVTPPVHMELLVHALSHTRVEYTVIPECSHVFRSEAQIAALRAALSSFLLSI